MKRFGLVSFLFAVCGVAVGQQFRISEYENNTITIEYPPSFAGAYLFTEANTNLMGGEWGAFDFMEISLVEGAEVMFTPTPSSSPSVSSTNAAEVPYFITPEYIQAVANGEIVDTEWTAGIAESLPPQEGDSGFIRIAAISYIDTDGDGVDNVSEYEAGTDPNVADAPPVNLPEDDGDPQAVPGSVDSAPGDWNTPPQTIYRATVGLHGAVNARILAMDGTNGTFPAEATPAELGAWIESMCGTWTNAVEEETYPTVEGGRFFRTETNGFSWAGKENIYALALHPHDGSEQFANHLIQSGAGDPAGLALLTNGTPVLVDAGNPWTAEKIEACLPHFITVRCRLQRTVGWAYDAIFDQSDTTAMAQGTEVFSWRGGLTNWVTSGISKPRHYLRYYIDNKFSSGWKIYDPSESMGNVSFTFLDNLELLGYGATRHSGYIRLQASTPWQVSVVQWIKRTLQPAFPGITETHKIYKTFTCDTGETAWIFAGSTNMFDYPLVGSSDVPPSSTPDHGFHYTGVFTDVAVVLSTIDPPMTEAATLIMDFDRDGIIGTNDLDRVDESLPFRFWVNEDGNNAAFDEANLEDFFPAQFVAPPLIGSNLTFKLSANVNLDYVITSMTTNNTDAYLTELDEAASLSGKIQSLSSGVETSETFAENDVVLLAASQANANAEVYVHILQGGSEIAVSINHFSFSPVGDMYRTKNLRTGGTSTTDEPSNWPDELTNGKDFVFVHGFNVDEPAGHEWNKTIFKRLWHSGSNAKFHGTLWDGTPPAVGDKKHYHNAVVNAFATAPNFAVYLNALNNPVVMAHSLGNIVASSAVCDSGANVHQYYVMNAAVAKEAYGDSAPNENMIPDGSLIYNQDEGIFSVYGHSWHEYPFETYASEWYRLFSGNDARSELTWRHRFADIQEKTDVFNFYSSTEDILRVDTGYTSIVSGLLHGNYGLYAFQIQELFKGKNDAIANIAGGSDPYIGWRFTKESETHIIDVPVVGWDLKPINKHIYFDKLDTTAANASVRAEFRNTLKTDPLFRPNPPELFDAGGSAFVEQTMATSGFTFNYDLHNATVDIADVPVRNYLLAKAFPARTGPMGSRANGKWHPTDGNFDMSTQFRNPYAPVLPNDEDDWTHSAFKDYSYVHMCNLFRRLLGREIIIINP
ncbi:MAG: hypothetical protein V3V05_11560 [Pontiella sp.]